MLFHWSKYSKSALVSLVIVVVNVVFNHCHEFFAATETLAVIPFALEYSPEPFHRTVVDAFAYPGHTLRHTGFLQFGMEHPVGVLEPTIRMA